METKNSNLYQLDGRVPLLQAIPFGLQHVLAMFVSNITPIIYWPMSSVFQPNSVLIWSRTV